MRTFSKLIGCALFLAVPAFAYADGPLFAVEGLTSTVMQEGQSSFSGLAIRTRLHDVRLIEGWEVVPSVEYWRNSSTVEPFGIQTSRRDLTLAADVRYNLRLEGWTPYLGVGIAAHSLSNKVNAPALGLIDAENTLMKGGLSALVGASFPMGVRFENFVELKYHHVTDYRQLKLNWGLAWKL